MNLPQRHTVDVENVDPVTIVDAVLRARDHCYADRYYGPFVVNAPGPVDLRAIYSSTMGTTLEQRILAIYAIDTVVKSPSDLLVVSVAQKRATV